MSLMSRHLPLNPGGKCQNQMSGNPGKGQESCELAPLPVKSRVCPSWWGKLAEDQDTQTPKKFLRTVSPQLKWCENPEIFSSDRVFTAEMV